MTELATTRLTLRRPTKDDIPAVFAVNSQALASALNPSDRIVTLEDAAYLYGLWDDHWARYGFGYWVVRMRSAEQVLGFCGVKRMHLDGREVLNLFYRLDPAAWGQGIATEAASAVVGWAVANGPALPIIARISPANSASIRVAERVGLVRAPELDTVGEDGPDLIYVWATRT